MGFTDYSILYRTAYNRLQHNEAATETEFVKVRKDLKGYVIGKEGCSIKEIMKSSGAIITSPQRNEDGFFVRGDAGQRECARRLILEKAVRAMCYNNITTNIMSVPNEFSDSLFVFVRGFACMDPGSPLSISCEWETHNTYR